MNNLNSRQLQIINILKTTTKPISSNALAEDIGCSTKTIQAEIKNINSILDNITIESFRGIGYRLVGNLNNLTNLDISITKDDFDRVSYILKKILFLYKDHTLKIENLADEMYVSLSTIKNDLSQVKNILQEYNLKIVSKHKLGIGLEGNIQDLIRCILENSINYHTIQIDDFFSEFIGSNILVIRTELLNKLEAHNLVFTDYEFNNMFNFILLHLSLENDSDYISYINYCITIYQTKLQKQDNEASRKKILDSINKFIDNLALATSIDLSNDEIFKDYLCKHIINFCIKNDLNINIKTPISNDIKSKYPFAFELASIAKRSLENDLNIKIDETEVANIAIHIGGALQRSSNNKSSKIFKTIIVCTSGIGTSMLIKAKLESKFNKRIEILKVIPSYLVEFISAMDVDFIITTVPIRLGSIPVINISPLLDDTEITIIEKFLETGNIYHNLNLFELFNEDLFFTDLPFDNKYDVIGYMSDKLLEANYIDQEMKNSYYERESIATTEIGNMVAIPHGANGKVFKNAIAIGILKNSIPWEIGQVRLVIMLSLQKENLLNYESLFSNIYKRIDSIAKVISICESKKYEKFIAMFK